MGLSTEEIENIAKATAKQVLDKIEFRFDRAGYTMAGFIQPQEDIGAFDRAKEDELVKSCHQKIAEVFGNPNKFEKRLAKMEHIPLEGPATKSLYSNVIYTDKKEYYCAGSGGKGSGKVFWTPYTIKNKELQDKILQDEMCDNCKTLAHELQHGIGATAEFDFFSSLPAFYNRLEHFPEGSRLEDRISALAWSAEAGCQSNFKQRYQRKARNELCAINERYPQELKEILKKEGLPEGRIVKILDCACGKGGEET